MKKSQLKKIIKEEIQNIVSSHTAMGEGAEEDTIEVASMSLISYPGGKEYPLWIHELTADSEGSAHPFADDSGYFQISTSGAKIWVNKEKWEEFKALINRIQ